MKLRSGIKLLAESEGYREPIEDNDRCDAVLKFYRNQEAGPLVMRTAPTEPIPYVSEGDSGLQVAWEPPTMVASHIVVVRNLTASRGADMLPGIYCTLLRMRAGGYRHVAIPPNLYGHSMYEIHRIDRDSVIRLECFLTSGR